MALLLTTGSAQAQTVISKYKPGVTSEGAVYYLPKTAIRVTFKIEKSTYTPGEFCKYSEKYLRVKNVSSTPSTRYRLIAVSQEPFAVADTSKCYAVKFDARTAACNIKLSGDGILMAINRDVPPVEIAQVIPERGGALSRQHSQDGRAHSPGALRDQREQRDAGQGAGRLHA